MEYQRLNDMEENYLLLLEALKRDKQRDPDKDVTFEDLCQSPGIDEASVENADDPEIEL